MCIKYEFKKRRSQLACIIPMLQALTLSHWELTAASPDPMSSGPTRREPAAPLLLRVLCHPESSATLPFGSTTPANDIKLVSSICPWHTRSLSVVIINSSRQLVTAHFEVILHSHTKPKAHCGRGELLVFPCLPNFTMPLKRIRHCRTHVAIIPQQLIFYSRPFPLLFLQPLPELI